MDLKRALAYLDEHVDLEKQPAVAGRVAGLSLEPMRRLAEVFGDPQQAYPVIHVTGTNGKGSVARIVSTVLAAHGLRVGTYTSPHLQRINERIALDLAPIDDDDLAELITDVARLEPLSGVSPSYFELLTMAGLWWFAQAPVDVAVVEVGLLGRFDATNVVDADVAVVTNVSADHTDFAPGWRQAVASEKAGIVKPDSLVVIGETDPDAVAVIGAEPSAGTFVRERDFDVESDTVAVGGRIVDLRLPASRLDELFVPLHGAHQADNLATALTAVEAFFGRELDHELVQAALGELSLPGRFEVVSRQPLIVLDAAHNVDGAGAVHDAFFDDFHVAGRRLLVVGLLRGRDPRQLLEALGVAAFDAVVVCQADTPRALPAADLAEVARGLGADVEVAATVAEGVQRAVGAALEDDAVLVTGSIYVVGEGRAAFDMA